MQLVLDLPMGTSFSASRKNVCNDIDAALTYRLSNTQVESMNTGIRLLTRMAFAFHSAQALIALAKFRLGGLCRSLPGK